MAEKKKKVETWIIGADLIALIILIFLISYFVFPKTESIYNINCNDCKQTTDCNMRCTTQCLRNGYAYTVYSGNTTKEKINCVCGCSDILTYFKR